MKSWSQMLMMITSSCIAFPLTGKEVTDGVMDSQQRGFDQAENRMWAQMSILISV